jgi:myo-inositol 2-dehydrogenase/D-chiro-inositol 1-dehydrogenase
MKQDTSRREFLTRSTTALAAGALTAELTSHAAVHAAGSDILRVGLIGCGRRGTGAAEQALRADPHTQLVAMADVFADQLQYSLNTLKKSEVGSRVAVDDERHFVGFDAYQKLLASGVDVVLLATPPHFRPEHLQAAVTAGKHVFAEKPVAVDAPGIQKVMAACVEAKRKNLAVGSGLHNRYAHEVRAAIAKLHDGAIGDVLEVKSAWNGNPPGKPWPMIRKEGWSDMEYQLRNWYFWTWLSGDHIVEQAIHSIDKGLWAVHDQAPAAAVGLGGLQARFGSAKNPDRGQIFDHHAVVYEYSNGLKHLHTCRQQKNCANDISTWITGTKGRCHLEKALIYDHAGKVIWKYSGKKDNPYQTEHDELFAGLRAGKIIHNGDYMIRSTMVAILGRMATYTGKKISWERALSSKEDMTPVHYAWGPLPTPKVAIPGVTPFA